MLGLLTEAGQTQKYPRVCPHCDKTYWIQPGALIPPGTYGEGCSEALRAAKGEDEGSRWWVALLEQGILRGKGQEPAPISFAPTANSHCHKIVRG